MKNTNSDVREFIATRNTPRQVAIISTKRRRECARFLLGLGQLDPATLVSNERPGDVANLCSDLIRFGLAAALVFDPTLKLQTMVERITPNPKRTLAPLIAGVKELLDAVVDGQPMTLPIPSGSRLAFNGNALRLIEREGFPGSLAWRMGAGSDLTFTLAVKRPRLRDQWTVFLFNAMRQLDSEQGIMVRRCQREACRKIFLAARPKQIFCERKCAGAVALAHHIAKDPEAYKAKHRKSARQSWKSPGAKLNRLRRDEHATIEALRRADRLPKK